ncbi:MAG: mitochondrial fission ELM1 family protein [Alphaproteobacteria bacterium]
MNVWGLAASAGMEAQVRALAEALNLDVQMKEAEVKPPFVWLPNSAYAAGLSKFVIPHLLAEGSDGFSPPWPDVVISCGRRPAMVAMGLQSSLRAQRSNPELDRHGSSSLAMTKFIHIQDPHVSPKHFDVVVAMQHDAITGNNVIKTQYALHSITQEKLWAAQAKFQPIFANYPKPYISVLLGGSTNKYKLTLTAMQEVITKLRAIQTTTTGTLLITVSRRTGENNTRILKEVFGDNQRVHIYDGIGENPYMGMLALADSIFVTNDSVNMMSEAAATGKPLYILPLAGHTNTKPSCFADGLINTGVAHIWTGSWDGWSYNAADEMRQLAERIRAIL